MIRSLLVAYDGSHGARVALQHGVDLASRCEGRVCLLMVGRADAEADAPEGEGGVDLVALAQDVEAPTAEGALEETDEVLQEAMEVCRDLTVRCVAKPAYGGVPGALVRGSELCDLVVMGRDALGGDEREGAMRTARRVASQAGCPVAITPREYQPIRSAVAVCPVSAAGARAVRTAAELASILQVKLETLLMVEDRGSVGGWERDLKRYLVDHGHPADVQTRKLPAAPHLDSVLPARQSPLVVVPRGGGWESLRRTDLMSAALGALGATVVVVP